MTSLDSLTVSLDCDICKWVSPIDKQCYAFSAGKLLAASSLHCVNCMFLYALYLSRDHFNQLCLTKAWFNPLCLLQSIAISRTHSSLTPNQKMHKQQTCVAYKWAYFLCRHLCLRSDVISNKMRDALKPSLHYDEEPYNIEFSANLGPARCDVGTFWCMLNARLSSLDTPWWKSQPTQLHVT